MKYDILLTLFIITISLSAQNKISDKDALLVEIEKNNTTLAALRQKVQTQKIENKIGTALPDPKVGFSNSWGNQPTSPTKQNVSVEQELNWGTISGQRRRVNQTANDLAEINYRMERQTILAEADQLIVQQIYFNTLLEEMKYRVTKAQNLKQLYEKKLELGDANQIEVNKVRLNLIALTADMRKIKAGMEENRDQIRRMNGNHDFTFNGTEYPKTTMPPLSDLLERVKSEHPQIQRGQKSIEHAQKLYRLSKTEGLPSLNIGYAGEYAKGNNTNGFSIGVNIPLWGNSRRKVEKERAAITFAELEKADIETQIMSTISRQYAKTLSLTQIAMQFKNELRANEDIKLLDRALELGEISLIDYLNEITFYYTARTQAIEAEKDCQIAYSILMNQFR